MSGQVSPASAQSARSPSHYVQERDPFLALFPHRFDYIYAALARPGESPEWFTVSNHPLSDRLIHQGGRLYGVRFGKATNYALIDIDRGSAYHPSHDPFAVSGILSALDLLGITRCIRVTSSHSKGIHLYLPFEEPQNSSVLALALETALERAGFTVAPGQLELFPDPKPFIPQGAPRLFAAHRLPLQVGSYLLNEDWQPCFSSPEAFVHQWRWCCQGNGVSEAGLKGVLKTYRRRQYQVSAKAAKFLNDLNAEIELGWSSHGQTNRLLGRIAMREYIFGHILYGEGPLEGVDLVQRMVKTAIALPGYTDWCRHQHEIVKRAEDWARSVESCSRYFPYGSRGGTTLSSLPTEEDTAELSWNEQQQLQAREKIRRAIAAMLEASTLPTQTTARIAALRAYGVSNATLYKHRDLWHPEHLRLEEADAEERAASVKAEAGAIGAETGTVENSGQSKSLSIAAGRESMGDSARPAISLLGAEGCNAPSDHGLSDLPESQKTAGCNDSVEQLSLLAELQPIARQEAWKRQQQIRQERSQQRHIDQMQRWMDSGDPILVAEAKAWAAVNPGVLDIPPPE